mgnify:CR=1 FL=1
MKSLIIFEKKKKKEVRINKRSKINFEEVCKDFPVVELRYNDKTFWTNPARNEVSLIEEK